MSLPIPESFVTQFKHRAASAPQQICLPIILSGLRDHLSDIPNVTEKQDQPEISDLEDVLKKRNRQCHGTKRGVAGNKKDSIFLRKSEHSSDQGAFAINLAISNSKFRYVSLERSRKDGISQLISTSSIQGRNNEKKCEPFFYS